MDKIQEIINRIENLTLDYQKNLQGYETILKTVPLSSTENGTDGQQINHQTKAYNLLNQYMNGILESISEFKTKMDEGQKIDFLIEFGKKNPLTNGKFYDYAVIQELWIEKEPKLYDLITSKIREFIDLEMEINEEFGKKKN